MVAWMCCNAMYGQVCCTAECVMDHDHATTFCSAALPSNVALQYVVNYLMSTACCFVNNVVVYQKSNLAVHGEC